MEHISNLKGIFKIKRFETFKKSSDDSGRSRQLTVKNEEKILVIDICRRVVQRRCYKLKVQPYHLQPGHGLQDEDRVSRMEFWKWFINRLCQSRHNFIYQYVIDLHNHHVWSNENQKPIPRQFSIYVWTRTVGDVLIGPIMLAERLNREVEFTVSAEHTAGFIGWHSFIGTASFFYTWWSPPAFHHSSKELLKRTSFRQVNRKGKWCFY